jgi:hypothetical protein
VSRWSHLNADGLVAYAQAFRARGQTIPVDLQNELLEVGISPEYIDPAPSSRITLPALRRESRSMSLLRAICKNPRDFDTEDA